MLWSCCWALGGAVTVHVRGPGFELTFFKKHGYTFNFRKEKLKKKAKKNIYLVMLLQLIKGLQMA